MIPPPIFLAVARMVAVSAFPVTSPVRSPTIPVPTYSFLAMDAPPSVLKAPVSPVASDASVVFVISTTPLKVLVPV